MATSIQFYHLTTTPLDRALPKLLEKAVAAKMPTLLIAGSDEQLEHLNQWLWTYDPNSFLPHGSEADGEADKQPVLLSTQETPANAPKLLLVTNGLTPQDVNAYERIIDMFDGNDPQAVASARTRWTGYKNSGCTMAYMRQTENGGWEQKAG